MKQTNTMTRSAKRAREIIRKRGGIIHTGEALKVGIHPRTLYRLRDEGGLEQLSRGVFQLAERVLSNPDLVTVATRIPNGVICLVSALAFHNITTQIPRTVSIALKKGAATPRLSYPPISSHRFSDEALQAGVERHTIDGVPVNIYSAEKTLAECFKFRNKLGMDIVLEALKLYKARKPFKPALLLKYARTCRVEKVMRPYLEAIL